MGEPSQEEAPSQRKEALQITHVIHSLQHETNACLRCGDRGILVVVCHRRLGAGATARVVQQMRWIPLSFRDGVVPARQ